MGMVKSYREKTIVSPILQVIHKKGKGSFFSHTKILSGWGNKKRCSHKDMIEMTGATERICSAQVKADWG